MFKQPKLEVVPFGYLNPQTKNQYENKSTTTYTTGVDMDEPKREPTYDYMTRKLKEEAKNSTATPIFPQFSGAREKQVGGSHYKSSGIQPVDYIYQNELDFFEGNIIKYTTRHRKKGEGSEDIKKVIHYAELILELVYNEKP